MSPSNITRAGLITIISSPWKGCLKSPKRQVHGMLPWHAFSWIHCFSRLSPLQLHVSLQGNIHPVHELNWKTFNWSSLLQPTAEFWTQVHCRTILTQTLLRPFSLSTFSASLALNVCQFSTAGLSSAVPPGMSETCWHRQTSLRMHTPRSTLICILYLMISQLLLAVKSPPWCPRVQQYPPKLKT